MPDDNRMVLLAVMPPFLCRQIERQFGDQIRKAGDMFATDLTKDTEAQLSDDVVKIEVKIRRKDGARREEDT